MLTSILDFARNFARPFIIYTGWLAFLATIFLPTEPPELLLWLVGAITVEYFGERAILKLKK